jgi:mRNA interferase MazF
MYRFKAPDKRRPVVVLSRQDVIPLLHTVMVAPVTWTTRGAPSEVPLGPDTGLKRESSANLDHVQTVEQHRLVSLVGTVSPTGMQRICQALAIATGCA